MAIFNLKERINSFRKIITEISWGTANLVYLMLIVIMLGMSVSSSAKAEDASVGEKIWAKAQEEARLQAEIAETNRQSTKTKRLADNREYKTKTSGGGKNNVFDKAKELYNENKQSIGRAMTNIATSIPSIEKLIFACAWIIGLCLVIKSLFDMVKAGSGQSQQVGWGGIMLTFSIGILLIALADTIGILIGTIGITSETLVGGNPELQQIGKGSQKFSDYALAMVKAAFAILKPFGFFAVIKGLLILKDVPQNRNNATAGSGATFIIGGILLANVEWAACTIEGTFSSSSSICG